MSSVLCNSLKKTFPDNQDDPIFEYGDRLYYQLYNRIKPEAVISMVDDVIAKHVKLK